MNYLWCNGKRLFAVAILCAIVVSQQKHDVSGVYTNSGVHSVLDVVKLIKDMLLWVSKSWLIVDDQIDFESLPPLLVDKVERKLFNKLNILNSRFDAISNQILSTELETVSLILAKVPNIIRYEYERQNLIEIIQYITTSYDTMQKYYSGNRSRVERETLEDFATSVVSNNPSSVRNGMTKIYNYMVQPRNEEALLDNDFLSLVAHNLEEVENQLVCDSHQSPQQLIYTLYSAIALTQLKGYVMIQFAYMLKRLYHEGNFTTEAELSTEQYKQYTNDIIKAVQEKMVKASRHYHVCDPKKHIAGETYEEITQLMQGYIQNEVDMNTEGTCRETCADYRFTKQHGCFKNQFCAKQRPCHGNIINCQFVDSDMWVCPSRFINSTRRYEYINYENGRRLGQQTSCPHGSIKVDSWWRWLFWHCSYCMCLCDEQGIHSDRYINLRASIADISNNKVVTGVRFTKHNRIIHLQIQQGQLLPRGHVNVSTIEWVPVHDYRITDDLVVNGVDYHTLTWEKRSIDLDDLVAANGFALTGVRFKLIGSHLNFEIYVSPFNFETGKLIDPTRKSFYMDNSNTDVSPNSPRTNLHLEKPDVPTRQRSPSLPDSLSDQYVEFTHTDFDADAAQSTVPFIDIQAVASQQPIVLSGAGIYHKGLPFSGGYIAPKIISYDFSTHVKPLNFETHSNGPAAN